MQRIAYRRKRTQVTTETRVIVAIRQWTGTSEGDCSACSGHSEWLDVEGAMAVSRRSAREIFRFIDAGHLHFHEGSTGGVLICSASLAAVSDEDQGGMK